MRISVSLCCMLFSLFIVIISANMCVSQQKQYTAGEVFTHSSYQYGRITAKIQSALGSGIISGMFTYRNEAVLPENYHPEIDIEIFGRNYGRKWWSNIRVSQDYDDEQDNKPSPYPAFHERFHCYSIEWTPDYVRWFVDDVQIREETDPVAMQQLDHSCDIRFNLWPSSATEWAGPFDTDSIPVAMMVDWVEYARYNPDGTFTVEWKDDFISLDTDRWGLSDHTFAGNLADFVPENVSIRDGALVLCLKERIGNNCAEIVVDTTKTMSCTTVESLEKNTSPILYQNYPNPCRQFTNVTFSMPHAGQVSIRMYNISGRTVRILRKGVVSPGVHTLPVDISVLQPGMYFYEMRVGSNVATRQLVVLK